VAGTGIALTGNNTTKTLTIASSSTGIINPGIINTIPTYADPFPNATGTTIDDSKVRIRNIGSAVQLEITTNATEDFRIGIDTAAGGNLTFRGDYVGSGAGIILETYGSTNNSIEIHAGTDNNGVPTGNILINSPLVVKSLTSEQRTSISNVPEGSLIWNSSDQRVNVRTSTGWDTLSISAGGGTTAVVPPIFNAYSNNSTSISTGTTWTLVTLNAEEVDTDNFFNTASFSRFLPTQAGYYHIIGRLAAVFSSNQGVLNIGIWRNGSAHRYGSSTPVNQLNNNIPTATTISTVIYFNGTTDYIQLYANYLGGATNATATTVVGQVPFGTRLEGYWIRA
jgi:hypothetical protein